MPILGSFDFLVHTLNPRRNMELVVKVMLVNMILHIRNRGGLVAESYRMYLFKYHKTKGKYP